MIGTGMPAHTRRFWLMTAASPGFGSPVCTRTPAIQSDNACVCRRLPGLNRDRIGHDGAQRFVLQEGFVTIAKSDSARGWHDRR